MRNGTDFTVALEIKAWIGLMEFKGLFNPQALGDTGLHSFPPYPTTTDTLVTLISQLRTDPLCQSGFFFYARR